MEPFVHNKAEGAKKAIIATGVTSPHGPRTRSKKPSASISPRHTRNRAKAIGTSNAVLENGSLPCTNSPEKIPLHYARGNLNFSPGMQLSYPAHSLSAMTDASVARFNATLFPSATQHLTHSLDVEEAMDIDHQENEDELTKSNHTVPLVSSAASERTSPAPSERTSPAPSVLKEDKCRNKTDTYISKCIKGQATKMIINPGQESKDDSKMVNKKKEASNSVLERKSRVAKVKPSAQSKKRAIYIVLHVSSVSIGELVGKATAPVKIYGEKIFVEMETADGSSGNQTFNFRIPCKDLVECKASVTGPPFLIFAKLTPSGATAIQEKLKGKGTAQLLDLENKDLHKRHVVLLLNYKVIPRDVKTDLIELFQNRLSEQLTWTELSPDEAKQIHEGKRDVALPHEETNTGSPIPNSPVSSEQRKILTPKGKGARKKIFTDTSKAAEVSASPSSPSGNLQNAHANLNLEKAETESKEERKDGNTVPIAGRRRKASTHMDTVEPVKTGSEPIKPDILMHHKEMESHISLLDQHSKEQRENLEQHQKLLEIEREKLRAVKDEKDRHIGRMRDLENSFIADKETLIQRIKALETALAERNEAFTQQTVTLNFLQKEFQDNQTTLRQLRRELAQKNEATSHLTNLEGDLTRARKVLGEETAIRNMREQQLRDKETMIQNLQSNLSEEQRVRLRSESELQQERGTLTELRENWQRERLSYEQELQNIENTLTEQRQVLEQERQGKTTLEERIRVLQIGLEDERNRRTALETETLRKRNNLEQCRASLEREREARARENRDHERILGEKDQHIRNLESAVAVAQDAVADYHRLEPRDWIIRRDEVQLSEKRLGVGAWGTVCEGSFRGCQVAVKQIHQLILSPHNRRLFEREMSIASRCRHPNLLQFIGATNDDGSPLFITELLDSDLRRILAQRALHHEEIVCLALDIARALNYLHLNKPFPILHRDISSSNVLLWRREDTWRAKLSDYGAANFLRQCMTANPGALIYAAPESLTSQQSPKADVYSFGLLLCEMCVRELPVPEQIQVQINLVSSGVLRELIMRCVERNPEARPSMGDVITVLVQLTESLRVQGLVSINGRSAAL